MSGSGRSFTTVRYDLRPAKQVERLMLIDAFKRLDRAGLPISSYRYVGMGSVHFYDFILFHRYLGIHKMTSAEINQDIKKRVRFNQPFSCVEIDMRAIGDVVDDIPADERVVLWLDYDDRLERFHLEDFGRALGRLAVGSLILFTIDLEPPRIAGVDADAFYRQRLGNLVPRHWTKSRFAPSGIQRTVSSLIDRTVRNALHGRAGVTFEPIVQFTYRDGHRMLSLGGVIATDHERKLIAASELDEERYYRGSLDSPPFDIHVPVLTRRERLYLDTNMPARASWKPSAFELSTKDLQAYRDIYRFTPLFAELLA